MVLLHHYLLFNYFLHSFEFYFFLTAKAWHPVFAYPCMGLVVVCLLLPLMSDFSCSFADFSSSFNGRRLLE